MLALETRQKKGTSNLDAILHVLGDTASQEQKQRTLYILMAPNLRRNARCQTGQNVRMPCQLVDAGQGLWRRFEELVLLFLFVDEMALHVGIGQQTGLDGTKARVGHRQEDLTIHLRAR